MTKLHSVPRSWNPPRRCQGMRPRRFGKRQQLEISPSTSAWRVRLRSSVPQPVLGIFCRSNRSVLTLEMICFQIFQDPVTSGGIRWHPVTGERSGCRTRISPIGCRKSPWLQAKWSSLEEDDFVGFLQILCRDHGGWKPEANANRNMRKLFFLIYCISISWYGEYSYHWHMLYRSEYMYIII